MHLSARELATQSPAKVLSTCLCIGGVISTPSSYAQRNGGLLSGERHEMTEIGRGFQGALFEHPLRSNVLKMEHPGNSELPTNLGHEYALHLDVAAAFGKFGSASGCTVQVPEAMKIFTPAEISETDRLSFPGQYQTHETVVEMTRILPVPKVVREAIWGAFHEEAPCESREDGMSIRSDVSNKHCLVRIYLGRIPRKKAKFSLRNFPLDLDAMKSLHLDIHGFADSMGAAFAIMHWGAGVNGDDVEFVLGTRLLSQSSDFVQEREMGFYLIDFGQCDAVDLTGEGPAVVYQAFKGAMVTGDNQLFIPHCLHNPELYKSFRDGYKRAGEYVLQQRGLAGAFDIEEFLGEYEEYVEDFM